MAESKLQTVWTDILAAGLPHEKLDGQPLEVLMGLWKQLHSDQCYHPLPPKQMRANTVADQELALYAVTDFLPDLGWGQGTRHIGTPEDRKPFVELTIHWSPQNVQWMLALVDAGADSSLLYGNPGRFWGLSAVTGRYNGQIM